MSEKSKKILGKIEKSFGKNRKKNSRKNRKKILAKIEKKFSEKSKKFSKKSEKIVGKN